MRIRRAWRRLRFVASLAPSPLVRRLPFEVGPTDGLTYAAIPLLLVLVANAACVAPSPNVVGVDPEVLRERQLSRAGYAAARSCGAPPFGDQLEYGRRRFGGRLRPRGGRKVGTGLTSRPTARNAQRRAMKGGSA